MRMRRLGLAAGGIHAELARDAGRSSARPPGRSARQARPRANNAAMPLPMPPAPTTARCLRSIHDGSLPCWRPAVSGRARNLGLSLPWRLPVRAARKIFFLYANICAYIEFLPKDTKSGGRWTNQLFKRSSSGQFAGATAGAMATVCRRPRGRHGRAVFWRGAPRSPSVRIGARPAAGRRSCRSRFLNAPGGCEAGRFVDRPRRTRPACVRIRSWDQAIQGGGPHAFTTSPCRWRCAILAAALAFAGCSSSMAKKPPASAPPRPRGGLSSHVRGQRLGDPGQEPPPSASASAWAGTCAIRPVRAGGAAR